METSTAARGNAGKAVVAGKISSRQTEIDISYLNTLGWKYELIRFIVMSNKPRSAGNSHTGIGSRVR